MNLNDSRGRRGLIGLQEVGKPPTTPTEVLLVHHEDLDHEVSKQLRSACVNGIDTWWVETTCGRRVVVTASAVAPQAASCLECLFISLDVPPAPHIVLKPAQQTLTQAMHNVPPHLR